MPPTSVPVPTVPHAPCCRPRAQRSRYARLCRLPRMWGRRPIRDSRRSAGASRTLVEPAASAQIIGCESATSKNVQSSATNAADAASQRVHTRCLDLRKQGRRLPMSHRQRTREVSLISRQDNRARRNSPSSLRHLRTGQSLGVGCRVSVPDETGIPSFERTLQRSRMSDPGAITLERGTSPAILLCST